MNTKKNKFLEFKDNKKYKRKTKINNNNKNKRKTNFCYIEKIIKIMVVFLNFVYIS